MLQYAHENGCPWNELTCRYAAEEATWRCCSTRTRTGARGRVYVQIRCRGGHLEVLQYAHENGCPLGRVYVQIRCEEATWRC